MKKYTEILNPIDVMEKLYIGKRVEGVLYVDPTTHYLTFKAYNRKPQHRMKDILVEKLPWGWVKDSKKRNKRFTSIPNDMSLGEKLAILDQENALAKKALVRQVLFGNENQNY